MSYTLIDNDTGKDIIETLRLKDEEIERLSKEVDMWNKKYNEQFDIINELENHCETMLSIFKQMTEEDKQKELHKYLIYDDFLTRLKRLKGDSSNE